MPEKKTKTKKSKASKPKMCLRQIDTNTIRMSDNENFPEARKDKVEKLPKGMVRVDAHTVVAKG